MMNHFIYIKEIGKFTDISDFDKGHIRNENGSWSTGNVVVSIYGNYLKISEMSST